MKFGFVLLLLAAMRALGAAPIPAPALPVDHAERLTRGIALYEKKVRTLLVENCVKCHGGEQTKGELDLTTREGLLRGGKDGPVVTLYSARTSRLIELISHAKDPHMPSKGDQLPEAAVAGFADWIDNGAPYTQPLAARGTNSSAERGQIREADRKWWAFRPLKNPLPPRVKASERSANPVDAFIIASLEAARLELNPPADRRTLIRRASFDLLGLPPTPEEVAGFERDTSPAAWAKVVGRLLDSPQYGERWARHWLDAARFAESSGFEHDTDRPNAYHYRDFVIQALNAGMPYDQFVRWQIAGDEFEPNTPLALMATGFLGAGVFPTQITANEVERTRYDALDDMLATTGTTMLGLTVGCARCHDHKFDPIPALDYYRMLATFTTTVRSDIDLDLQPEIYRTAKAGFDQEHAKLVAERQAYEARELPAKFAEWLSSGAPLASVPEWELLEPETALSQAGATFKKLPDGSLLAEGRNADFDVYTFTARTPSTSIRSLRLEALAYPSLPKGGPGRADNGNIGLSRIRVYASPLSGGLTNEIPLTHARATFEQNTNTLSIASALDDNPKTGWAIDPRFGTNSTAIFDFEKPVTFPGGAQLILRLEFELNNRHNIGRPRFSVSEAPAMGFDGDMLPGPLTEVLKQLHAPPDTRRVPTTEERAMVLTWWRNSDPGWHALQARVDSHVRSAPRPKLTKVMICGEGYPAVRMNTQGADFFNETYFLNRGSTDLKRGVATAGFLQVLQRDDEPEQRFHVDPPVGARFSGRRRALANWMTDVDHGAGHLLARVIVNRLWQHHFGRGIVATPNDFGTQGARPSHPELLDWLAAELVRNGWHLKPIHELILTSATYRQSATADAAQVQADPTNALFARRNPLRLEAEAVRDALLYVAGVLDPTQFGPGTLDSASRRRSIYFTVKRSQMIPAMQAFDAPEPLVSQGTRQTTTVAPQALLLMNSPQVRSWADAFARRFAGDADQPLSEAVTQGYRLALNRHPTAQEMSEALAFLNQQTARYQSAQKTNPQALARVDFAQILLNLTEFIYVE